MDPDLQTLEVYALETGRDKSHWLLLESLEGDMPVSQPPFDATSFPLGVLWS